MDAIDLDEAVTIAASVLAFLDAGEIRVGTFTWRDEKQHTWPFELTTDRSSVARPESFGFELHRGEAWGRLVLYARGFADLLFVDFETGRERVGEVIELRDGNGLAQYEHVVREFVSLFGNGSTPDGKKTAMVSEDQARALAQAELDTWRVGREPDDAV